MRELKFKALNPITKKFTAPFGLFDMDETYLIPEGEQIGEKSYTDDDFPTRKPDVHTWLIVQFIGLLDRNGREIYEGDIVEYFDWGFAAINADSGIGKIQYKFTNAYGNSWIYNCNPLTGVVEWNQDNLTYGPMVDYGEYDGGLTSFAVACKSRGERFDYPKSYFEVIGNIHEATTRP